MMRNESHGKLFNPVIVKKEFLGIDKGTILKFDAASGKYVSTGAHEDVSKDEYYYSGFAIALDPYLIQDLISGSDDDIFEVLPVAEKKKKKPLKVVEEEKPVVEEKKEEEVKPEPVPVPEPITPQATPPPTPELWFRCGLCRSVNHLATVKSGLFFPATADTRLILKCPTCSIETIVFYTGSEYEPDKKG